MSSLNMLAIPEQIEQEDRYVIATYYLETNTKSDIVSKISAIAVEQTTEPGCQFLKKLRKYVKGT